MTRPRRLLSIALLVTLPASAFESKDISMPGRGLPTSTQLVPAGCQESALAVVPDDGFSTLTLVQRFAHGDDRDIWHVLPGRSSKGYMLRLLSGYTGSSLHPTPRNHGVTVGRSRNEDDLWRIESAGNSRVRIVTVHDGRALAVRSCTQIGMTPAAPPADDLDTQFLLGGVPGGHRIGLPEKQNMELVSIPSRKVLDVFGHNRRDGAELVLWDGWGGPNQTFRIIKKGEARVLLQLPFSGKVLDANPAGGSGTAIYQWGDWGGPNQQWLVYLRRFRQPDGSVFIANAQTGLCLAIGGDARANGAPLLAQPCTFAENQLFGFQPQRPGPAGQAETRAVD